MRSSRGLIDFGVAGEAKTTSTPTTQAQVTYVSESVLSSKFDAKTFITEKKVEATQRVLGQRKISLTPLNKEEHDEYDESNTYVLERFNTTAGNPIKKILLKLNLSDHRKLKDGGEDFCYSDTERLSRSDEVLKLKNFKKRCNIKDFQVNKSRKMLKITMSNTSSRNKLNPEVNDHYNIFTRESQEARVGKVKGKTYNVLPRGSLYEAILKKKITKKEGVEGNFKIPCSIGGLKHVNALVDQGSNVNVIPYSTYMKLIDEMPAETDIRLLLASHSYIYPLGIADDVLVEVAKHVYPVDFVILDIKENEKRPFILGTPFLITAKAAIKFDKGTITLRSGKSKISFHKIPNPSCITKKGVKNDIEPIALTMTVNRLVLEWEEKIKLYLEGEMEFNQWRSKNFKGKHPTLITTKGRMNDEGEVM
ncbi:zinc finger, CCHC-type containing protein [Tanacetum coccineum]